MPGRDGTGPLGKGCATGRAMGKGKGRLVGGNQFVGRGLGLGMGNRGFIDNDMTDDAALIQENQKLKRELEELKKNKADSE